VETSGNTQVIQGSSALVSITLSDALADLSAATVTITRLNGTALVTAAAAAGGQYTLTPTQTAQLDSLRLTWSFTYSGQPWTATTSVEVVGALLFTLAEARAFDTAQLTNSTKYPDSAIAEARTRILDNFQRICNVAFVPRYSLRTIEAHTYAGQTYYYNFYDSLHSDSELLLPDYKASKLVSLEFWDGVQWTAQDITQYWITPDGCLKSLGYFFFPRHVRIGYEHGYSQPPQQIKRAALLALVAELIPSNMPDRALSWNISGSQYTLSVANGDNRLYGIPTVDSALALYSRSVIG
jgi:hypothetical protein